MQIGRAFFGLRVRHIYSVVWTGLLQLLLIPIRAAHLLVPTFPALLALYVHVHLADSLS